MGRLLNCSCMKVFILYFKLYWHWCKYFFGSSSLQSLISADYVASNSCRSLFASFSHPDPSKSRAVMRIQKRSIWLEEKVVRVCQTFYQKKSGLASNSVIFAFKLSIVFFLITITQLSKLRLMWNLMSLSNLSLSFSLSFGSELYCADTDVQWELASSKIPKTCSLKFSISCSELWLRRVCNFGLTSSNASTIVSLQRLFNTKIRVSCKLSSL